MDVQRYGIILNVENYDECVAFYRDLFGLRVMFSRVEGEFKLTCLAFGEAYLMIETEGHAEPGGKDLTQSPAKLRFNVSDIDAALARIKAHGIEAGITKRAWGSSIDIHDPDGNRVGIRDEATFAV